MLIVDIAEARTGQVLAAPVPHPEKPGHDLLKRGFVLEDKIIQRLREMGITSLYIDFPSLDDLDKHLAVQLSPARQEIYRQIRETITANQKRVKPAVSFTDYYAATRELILTMMSAGQHPIYMDQMSRLGGDAVGHATAVAHLALMMGIKLERYVIEQRSRLPLHHARETVNLGVAGMLHDMGKLKLLDHLQNYCIVETPPDDAEREQWESHARLGYEMIREGVEASASSAVLHHHQHFDGSGFPTLTFGDGTRSSLEGQKIHIFARIVFAADLFDRLSAPPGKRLHRSNLEVLHLIRSHHMAQIDPHVFDALQSIAPPFPPGSKVTLSDGTQAVVTQINPSDPYHPVVRRVLDEQLTLEEVSIDLKSNGAPAVTLAGGMVVEESLMATADN